MAVVFFGGEHADELAAAVEEALQFEEFGRRERVDGGGSDLAEVGDDGGVDAIRFGESAHALGEVADLAGIDRDGREPRGEQGRAVDRSLAEPGAQGIVVRAEAVEQWLELVQVGQVTDADRAAAHLVFVSRADTAPGCADLALARGILAHHVELAVQRQD